MAQSKITVSTVALGAGADDALLGKIASWGRGRSYLVSDVASVPQVFSKEAEQATGITLRELSFKPVVKKNVQLFKGIDFQTAPDLLGYVATKPKETSEILLEAAERKDPLLAQWQYGLGKTVMFASDVKDRWAVEWLQWAGYPKLWSQVVRQTMRSRDDSGVDLNVLRDRDAAKITIHAMNNELKSQLRVVRPDESVGDVPMHQAGPGSYEAVLPLKQKGSYLFRLVGENGGPSKSLTYTSPNEDDFYPPNTDLLKTISNETKGAFQPKPEDIFAADGEATLLPVLLWPYLAGIALVLYLGDVFLRRVRLFE